LFTRYCYGLAFEVKHIRAEVLTFWPTGCTDLRPYLLEVGLILKFFKKPDLEVGGTIKYPFFLIIELKHQPMTWQGRCLLNAR